MCLKKSKTEERANWLCFECGFKDKNAYFAPNVISNRNNKSNETLNRQKCTVL